ncbi:MAG: M20/M25/M40 family metallo-hydrolase [Thermomicrobiales bacterium]|nr:M20/M25/M40 family metallo-hydrolase [Thermomicrobiales bacterium]
MTISLDDLAELTAELVAIDSTNPDLVPGGAGEADVAAFVAGWLREAGLAVTTHDLGDGRVNVVGILPGAGGGRALMLNAHMDVVGAGGMAHPWRPRREGNRLYGRGAFDMKASLAAIMLIARAAAAWNLRGDLIATAVADEEYASIGTQHIVRHYTADAAIVTEPTGLELCVAHKGFVWAEVETTGVAAHGSLPDVGVDAITMMAPVLNGVQALDQALRASPGHPLLGPGSVHASLIQGGQELSSYPQRCVLGLERRTVPGESAAQVEAEIAAILEAAAAQDAAFAGAQRTLLVREPFSVAADEAIVELAERELRRARGDAPSVTGAFGWMDSALLAAAGIPTVILGPDGDGAHADEEWVDLSSVAVTVDALQGIVRTFCG